MKTHTVSGKVAIVTGGGRGIGKAIAKELANSGAKVAVIARNTAEVDATVAEIASSGGMCIGSSGDVTLARDVESFVSKTSSYLGEVDILVNNAARCSALGHSWQIEADEWWREIEVNVKGSYLFARSVLTGMVRRQAGCIINITSQLRATKAAPYASAYASSKAAILRFTDSLADEVRPFGVTVFAVHPGSVRTQMTEHIASFQQCEAWFPDFNLDQAVSPQLAAELVVYLASGAADCLSGRLVSVHDDVDALMREYLTSSEVGTDEG